jgi:4-aminobutyrate aminotransferase-like enzyme
MEELVHCCSYIYHVPVVGELAATMARITPGHLKKTFFANTGAEAIEGAMKLAKLYTGKHEVIALSGSFHGRTLATLSITGNLGRKRRGGPFMPGVSFAPVPSGSGDWDRMLEDVIRFSTSGDVAAFIAEPVLGEGGIIVPPEGYFQEVKHVLDRHGILFIADEVQTGFGRTGAMFAIEHFGVEPDILVTAKGIANGLPLAAFTTREEIAAAFRPGDHLSTFGGNPVSCAAALANISFIEREGLSAKSKEDGLFVRAKLQSRREHHLSIGEIRGLGLMIGFELIDERGLPAPARAEAMRDSLLERGVLIGVGGMNGNVVRFQPPLVITRAQIDVALHAIERSLHADAPTVLR